MYRYPCGDRNGSLGNVVISWLHMQCLYQEVIARAHGEGDTIAKFPKGGRALHTLPNSYKTPHLKAFSVIDLFFHLVLFFSLAFTWPKAQ